MACSPRRRIRLATVAGELTTCPRPVGPTHLRRLDTSNGCQDHTLLPYASAPLVLRVCRSLTGEPAPRSRCARNAATSTASHPTFVTIASRPSSQGGMAKVVSLIWVNREAIYFLQEDWTRIRGNCPSGKSRAHNNAKRVCGAALSYALQACTANKVQEDSRLPKGPPPDRPAAGHPRASFTRLDPALRKSLAGICALPTVASVTSMSKVVTSQSWASRNGSKSSNPTSPPAAFWSFAMMVANWGSKERNFEIIRY